MSSTYPREFLPYWYLDHETEVGNRSGRFALLGQMVRASLIGPGVGGTLWSSSPSPLGRRSSPLFYNLQKPSPPGIPSRGTELVHSRKEETPQQPPRAAHHRLTGGGPSAPPSYSLRRAYYYTGVRQTWGRRRRRRRLLPVVQPSARLSMYHPYVTHRHKRREEPRTGSLLHRCGSDLPLRIYANRPTMWAFSSVRKRNIHRDGLVQCIGSKGGTARLLVFLSPITVVPMEDYANRRRRRSKKVKRS